MLQLLLLLLLRLLLLRLPYISIVRLYHSLSIKINIWFAVYSLPPHFKCSISSLWGEKADKTVFSCS